MVVYRGECTEELEKFEDIKSCGDWEELVDFSILRSCAIPKQKKMRKKEKWWESNTWAELRLEWLRRIVWILDTVLLSTYKKDKQI